MAKLDERGQSLIITAFLFLGLALFVLFLIVDALAWYNGASATRQALVRAARDGATEMVLEESLVLTGLDAMHPGDPLPPLAASRHCLDPTQAEATARESLERNLARASLLYVKVDGAPLTPAEIAYDTSGTYIIEIKVVNPPALGCPESDSLPIFPSGATYNFSRPYVHIAARVPMKALFGPFEVHPAYAVDVTSAIDPRGG